MGSRVVQDSDEDSDGDIGSTMAVVADQPGGATPYTGTTQQPGEALFKHYTTAIDSSEESHAKSTVYNVLASNAAQDSTKIDTFVLHVQPHWTQTSLDRLHKDINGLERNGDYADSQKRSIDVDTTEEDELSLIPERKRSRRELLKDGFARPQELSVRASLPPLASRRATDLRGIRAVSLDPSADDSIQTQPSTPRLCDNLSFTTNGSASLRGSQTAFPQLFPSLEPMSPHGRHAPINISLPYNEESPPAASQQQDEKPTEKQPSHPEVRVTALEGQWEGMIYSEGPSCAMAVPKPKRGRPKKRERDRTDDDKSDDPAKANTANSISAGSAIARSRSIEQQRPSSDVLTRPEEPQGEHNHNESEQTSEQHTPSPERNRNSSTSTTEMAGSDLPELKRKEHSPISSSKVPVRVGLSKRARIEPLLKMVRK